MAGFGFCQWCCRKHSYYGSEISTQCCPMVFSRLTVTITAHYGVCGESLVGLTATLNHMPGYWGTCPPGSDGYDIYHRPVEFWGGLSPGPKSVGFGLFCVPRYPGFADSEFTWVLIARCGEIPPPCYSFNYTWHGLLIEDCFPLLLTGDKRYLFRPLADYFKPCLTDAEQSTLFCLSDHVTFDVVITE